jgi:hypothetical protein
MSFHNLNKRTYFAVFALFLAVSSLSLFAQNKDKSDLKKKLSEIKGKVEKITVTVDGKDVVFEGKDAEKLAKRMRASSGEFYISSYGRGTGKGKGRALTYTITDKYITDIREGDAEDEDIYVTVADKAVPEKEMKNIKVEKKDGHTKLTITTTDKDGKEVEKTLEGDEAEKYLEKNDDGITAHVSGICPMHSQKPVRVKVFRTKPAKTIIIEKGTDEEDDDTSVIIEKADKVKKDVVIKKKKIETDTKEKE